MFIWKLIILLLPLLVLKANRKWQAWMVLVPVVGVHVLALFAELAIPQEISTLMFQTIDTIVTGLGILWILSCLLENRRGIAAFSLAVVILAAAGIITVLTTTSFAFQSQTAIFMTVYFAGSLAILISMTASRAITRKQYSPARFRLWLLIWLVVIFCGCFTLFVYSISIFRGNMLPAHEVLQVFVFGLITGLVLFVLLIPFLILTFNNSVYRDRFDSVFNLKSVEN